MGNIIDCDGFRNFSEWCSAPVHTVALNSKGEIWQLVQQPPCIISSVFYGVAGALFGGILVGPVMAMLTALSRRQASNNQPVKDEGS